MEQLLFLSDSLRFDVFVVLYLTSHTKLIQIRQITMFVLAFFYQSITQGDY